MEDKITCKPIKKFGHFEVWNDGMLRIRQKAKNEEDGDKLLVFFPCDVDDIKQALKFQDDVFGRKDE